MEYREVLRYIGGTKKFGAKLGLEKPRRLMELLGDPQDSLRFVHIAGTNGKGSTAAFLSEILMRSGYKTGLFTSPFLYEFNERMRVDGENIPDDVLGQVIERVKRAADRMEQEGEEYPTEFEIVTAAAFCYFAQEECDIVVLEVGLGGRFDATNIIRMPLLSVITFIGLDHTQYLGDTVEQIAFEKCGIMKEGAAVVCACGQRPEALAVIRDVAAERGCRLAVCDTATLSGCECSAEGNRFFYRGTEYRTTLRGEYQIENALTAITAAEELYQLGLEISPEAVRGGLLAARWSGRLETLCTSPLIIADGSHNPDGMRAFARSAAKLAGGRRMVCVVGMMKDKNCAGCLSELARAVQCVVTTTVENPRAAGSAELAGLAQGHFEEIHSRDDVGDALRLAAELAGADGAVFAVGSLYLIGSVRRECVKL